MFLRTLTFAIVWPMLIPWTNAFPNNHTDALVNAAIEAGTFQDPSIQVRPRFRFWSPDASINLTRMAEDIKGIGEIGAGGVELLGYYLYGGNQLGPGYAPDDWSIYGWGTSAWINLVKTALQATSDIGLIMDFAMGPNQGQGVPAEVGSEGLAWDLAQYNVSVPIGGVFNATVPGWDNVDSEGNWSLQAVTIGLLTNSTNASTVVAGFTEGTTVYYIKSVLAVDSLKDITDDVKPDGTISYQFPESSHGIEYLLFATYMYHSNYRAQADPIDIGGPQSIPMNFIQNGSFVVDHFSSAGAQAMTDFWDEYILSDETVKSLLKAVGNYAWEDSIEIINTVYWTKDLLTNFLKRRGYSLKPYLPILFHGNGVAVSATSVPSPQFVTDDKDEGSSYINDFRQTLAEGYHNYLHTLTTWAHESLDVQFSAQVSYNLPLDMEENVPVVDAPECESLGFNHDIDSYRQYAGPANLAGKRIISNEMGANYLEVYATYVPEILWDVKRAFVGGVNQMVFHGATYSGNYGNTTWPGFTTFVYLFGEMYSRHQPAWEFYSDTIDYVARMQLVMQSGVSKRDVAFWNFKTSYAALTRTYVPTDLEEAGYTYEYLSPNNFGLPDAIVRQNILAPDRQAFNALIVRANDTLTVNGVLKLAEFAYSGLRIIFSGGIPGSLCSCNESDKALVNERISNIASLENVYQVPYENLAESLLSLNISPMTKFSSSLTWYTYWRKNSTEGDYVVVYYDALPGSPAFTTQNIEFAATGYAYIFDAWTGTQTPITNFTQSDTSITIPLTLAGNQTVLIAFLSKPLTSYAIQNSTCTAGTGQPTTLTNWTLIAEHWDPPSDLYDIETIAVKSNTTHYLPSLVSWQDIASLQNVSGLGYYSTTFTINDSYSGAIIDFGPIRHTIKVYINDQLIPPLDLTWARADISTYLVKGLNRVTAVVSTPLGNILRTIWNELETSGASAVNSTTAPAVGEYGLVGDVKFLSCI